MPKRITGIAVGGGGADIYLSLEIGGLLRSLDGGKQWTAAIDGLYVVEDAVDLHGVAVNLSRGSCVTVTTRVGTFRSDDHGEHWRKLPVPALREKGSYCRAIAYAPGEPDTILIGAGNDFDGDKGALFISRDDGATWDHGRTAGPSEEHGLCHRDEPTPAAPYPLRDQERRRLFFDRPRTVVALICLFRAARVTSFRSGSGEEASRWRTHSRTS